MHVNTTETLVHKRQASSNCTIQSPHFRSSMLYILHSIYIIPSTNTIIICYYNRYANTRFHNTKSKKHNKNNKQLLLIIQKDTIKI